MKAKKPAVQSCLSFSVRWTFGCAAVWSLDFSLLLLKLFGAIECFSVWVTAVLFICSFKILPEWRMKKKEKGTQWVDNSQKERCWKCLIKLPSVSVFCFFSNTQRRVSLVEINIIQPLLHLSTKINSLFTFLSFLFLPTYNIQPHSKMCLGKKIAAFIISGPNADEWCTISEQWSLSPVSTYFHFHNKQEAWLRARLPALQASSYFLVVFLSSLVKLYCFLYGKNIMLVFNIMLVISIWAVGDEVTLTLLRILCKIRKKVWVQTRSTLSGARNSLPREESFCVFSVAVVSQFRN